MYHEWVFWFLFPARRLISLYERHVVSVLYVKYFSLKYLESRQEEFAILPDKRGGSQALNGFPLREMGEGREEEKGERGRKGKDSSSGKNSPLPLRRFGAQFCIFLHNFPHQGNVMDFTGIAVFHPKENKRTTRVSQGKRKANWLYSGGWHWSRASEVERNKHP